MFVVLIVAASLSAQDTHKVVHGWPKMPDGFAFQEVSGVGVDSKNQVFAFHRGARPVMCFDGATGKVIGSWGDGLLARAHGLSIDAQDNIWLTDLAAHQVFKFNNKGELLMTLGAKGVPGLGPNHFNLPTDVAVGPTGDVFVSDGYAASKHCRRELKFADALDKPILASSFDAAPMTGGLGYIFASLQFVAGREADVTAALIRAIRRQVPQVIAAEADVPPEARRPQ